jgi:hypothetical protein
MNWLKNKICDWFHAGGDIKRDCYGRINWQCRSGYRWGEPVDPQTELLMTAANIKEAIIKEAIRARVEK